MDGTAFGRYRLIELLGRGGMGEVWRAFDTETNRIVAVKVLPPHLADDDEFNRRFRREALMAAAINEPHVVPIHTFGEIDGRLYVDMRLVEGQDLQAMLSAGPLEPTRAVNVIEQIASALDAAHRIGLIHRDVKPSNILIGDADFAYLIDFGIARSVDRTALTSAGITVGTWAYMAPERFTDGHTSTRVDVYALTCVLYQALTGQPPFPGDSLEQLISAHLRTPPPCPSQLRPGLPPHLDGVIATGMAKDPDQRFATGRDLAGAARAALTTPPHPSYPAPAPPPASVWAPPSRRYASVPAPMAPHVGVGMSALAPAGYRPPAHFASPDLLHRAPADAGAVPWWRRGPVITTAVVTLIAIVAVIIGVSTSAHESNRSGRSATLEAYPGPFLPDCGGLTEAEVAERMDVPSLLMTARNSAGCQWLENGSANGAQASFSWYRGSSIAAERATLETDDGATVGDLSLDGHNGFIAARSGNSICEVGIELTSPDDFIEWSVAFAKKPFPDPCEIAKYAAGQSIAALVGSHVTTGPATNTPAQDYPGVLASCDSLAPDIAQVLGTDAAKVQQVFTGNICRWQTSTGVGRISVTHFRFATGNLDNERHVAQSLKHRIEEHVIAGVASITMRPDGPNGTCGVASDAAGVTGWWVTPAAPGVDACGQATTLMETTLARKP